MSQYVVEQEDKRFVFGWDQPLKTFFLQVHDNQRPEEDRIVFWAGGNRFGGRSTIYEVEELVRLAQEHGLVIYRRIQMQLYRDKDDGR